MSALKARLIERIKAEGPMNIAGFMGAALFDKTDGFYPTRDPLGSEGDFITSPEISQMFGEMIGLWCVQTWRDMGAPAYFHLAELGPGRGVMMSDILRAAHIDPGFVQACNVTLIEASPALERVQAQTLSKVICPVSWAASVDELPHGPAIILGNEFLDCLPIRQFIFHNGAWRERVVMLGPKDAGSLVFAREPQPAAGLDLSHYGAPNEGDLAELCPGLAQIADALAQRAERAQTRALFIDYGPALPEFGDTLQAIAKHQKVSPLAAPGDADLTARVDFAYLAQEARNLGLGVFGPTVQGAFLEALGIETRAAQLARLNPAAKETLARQLFRITDPSEMGALFKVIALQSPSLPDPLGLSARFEPESTAS